MSEKRISELTTASAFTGTEEIPVVQSSATVKGKVRDVAKFGYQDILTDATGSKTLALTDRGAWIRLTHASANTLTVPTNASVAFATGESFNGVQGAAGQITFSPASGVTINKPTGYNAKTRGQGAAWCLIKVGTDTWDLIGDLEAS